MISGAWHWCRVVVCRAEGWAMDGRASAGRTVGLDIVQVGRWFCKGFTGNNGVNRPM